MNKYLVLDKETILENIEEFRIQLSVQDNYCREVQQENRRLIEENAVLKEKLGKKTKKAQKAKTKAKLLAKEVESLRQRYENVMNPMFLSMVQQNFNMGSNTAPSQPTISNNAPPPPPPPPKPVPRIMDVPVENEESLMDRLLREMRGKVKTYDP